MLNDRDGKYEGQDESEYHFSDEDVSYEVEPEAPKQTQSGGGGGGNKESILDRLSKSKRMIISGGVFLVLVFVVYKMVAPTTVVQPTDITAPATTAQQNQPINNQAPTLSSAQQAQPAAETSTPVATQATPPNTVNQPAMSTPMQPAVTVATTPTQTPMPAQQQMAQQPAMTQQPLQQQPQPQSMPQTVQSMPMMPTVMPVQSPAPYASNQPSATQVSMGNLSTESQQLMNQFQSETAQRLTQYAAETKQTQEQIQALNTRVINMEAQLNQLVQVLTQNRSRETNAAPVQHQPQVDHPKMPYNVQAIIPGRAWLRSDNGETITVAEGDMIKDLGKVTKIDPYDGVVEVNTGTRVVSLSYGNGG